ncbi:MAG: family 1 glycosylhydrolase [Ilumatobacteraceae bacterium]
MDGEIDREAFADYAQAVVERLADRVVRWTTINEPFVVANHGYLTGEHAPGHSSLPEFLAAAHHVLLAHGLGVERIRSVQPSAEVGIVLNFTPVDLADDVPAARYRARLRDEIENEWYLHPVAGRGYPAFATEELGWAQAEILPGDLELIAAPLDFLGINYYTRSLVTAFDDQEPAKPGGVTAMDWEVHPATLGRFVAVAADPDRGPGLHHGERRRHAGSGTHRDRHRARRGPPLVPRTPSA